MVKWKYLQKQWWKTIWGSPKKKEEKNRSFLSLWLKSFISWNIRSFLRVGFFIFRAVKVTYQNIRTAFFWEIIRNIFWVSISWSIRNFLQVDFFIFRAWAKSAGFHFRKYKISFLLRNYKKYFLGFHFLKYKKFSPGGFFYF